MSGPDQDTLDFMRKGAEADIAGGAARAEAHIAALRKHLEQVEQAIRAGAEAPRAEQDAWGGFYNALGTYNHGRYILGKVEQIEGTK